MEAALEILKPDRDCIDALSRALKCHPTLSTLLANRHIADAQAALDFIQPSLKNLRPPETLCDIDRAVERIVAAVIDGEKILVFGDYDVDGITATCLIFTFLKEIGAVVSYYIPHRINEGYSISAAHLTNGAVPAHTRLIITVDCGTTSTKAVEAASAAGIDVVVTDHHNITGYLPAAIAVINPKRDECTAGLEQLAGVGVVFYLVIALRKALRERQYFTRIPEPNLKKLCDLVALGTVADMVPLVQENRVLTAIGLDIINTGTRPGLNSLLTASKLAAGRVDSEAIAFKLAPRLNAAGRMGHASQSVDLLGATENENPGDLAAALENLNQARQKTEKEITENITDTLARTPALLTRPALVMSSDTWHPGVTGIVAARLARKYNRPAILVCTRTGIGKGSGRSVPGIDMVSCLHECAPLLKRFGGHPAAAGLTLETDNFDAFRERFEASVQKRVAQGIPAPGLRIDCELEFAAINPGLMDLIELLQPFGQGNPEPLFIARRVRVSSSRSVGQGHARLVIAQQTSGRNLSLPAIYFNAGTIPAMAGVVVFALHWNHWNGKKSIQAVVKHMA